MTDCRHPVNVDFNDPVLMSQILIFLSLDPVANMVPPFESATVLISESWAD